MRGVVSGLIAVAFAMLGPFGAAAGDIAVGSIIIEDPWSRATPPGATVAAGYVGVVNIAEAGDRLVGAKSDVAERVEIHSMKIENGIVRMRQLSGGLEIGGRSAVTLKPGGYHLMFIGLKKPLRKGQDFNVTLTFARAGKIDVLFRTGGVGGKSPYPSKDHISGSASGADRGVHKN